MKRTIILVFALAALAAPTALAQSPVDRINAQEQARGRDATVMGTAPQEKGWQDKAVRAAADWRTWINESVKSQTDALKKGLREAKGGAGPGPVARINAQEQARARDLGVVGTTSQPLTPVERIIAQERGRSNDPSLFQVPSTTPIQIVQPNGFDWGDAGIGAAGAVALMLVGLGTTLVLRTGRVRSA